MLHRAEQPFCIQSIEKLMSLTRLDIVWDPHLFHAYPDPYLDSRFEIYADPELGFKISAELDARLDFFQKINVFM